MKVSECALCHGAHFSPYLMVGKRQLVECSNCGFIFVRDIPSPEEMGSHYSIVMEPGYLEKYRELAIKRGDLILRNAGHRGGNVLDVGCGLGSFLGLARDRGYIPCGIEPSIAASNQARGESGAEVFTGDIKDFTAAAETFDVVTVQHVLEHIPRPDEFMQNIRRLLKKGGMLVVVVPNANSLIGRLAREKWLGFAVEEHVCHYTAETLRLLLEKFGFSAKRFLAPQWDVADLLWAFRVFIRGSAAISGQSGQEGRTTAQRSAVRAMLVRLLSPLGWIVSQFKVGQEIIAFSEKSSD